MGASFCNLYCKNEHADSLRERLPGDSRLLTGYGEWAVLLMKEFRTRMLMDLARYIPGDVLIFYCYDDESFGLYYYRDGKKAAYLDGGEYNSKVRTMAANLFPDDPLALKKLWAVKHGVSFDEKLALLEETFGLPFYAVYEDGKIAPAEKSSKTFDIMNARAKALRNRPNLYSAELLAEEEWPERVREGTVRKYSDTAHHAVMRNSKGYKVCFLPGKGLICSDEQGREQWAFFPEAEQGQGLDYTGTGDGVLTLVRDSCSNSRQCTAWRISAEDGSVLAERTITEDEVYHLWWMPGMNCYIYLIQHSDNIYVFLDRNFHETGRLKLQETGPHFAYAAYSGHYAYKSHELPDHSWEIARADFDSGEVKRTKLELPVFPHHILLSKDCLCCGVTGVTCDSIVFFGWDGKVISRNRVEGFLDIWEEDGNIYGLEKKTGNDTNVKAYLFRKNEKSN